jgi:hypothetical protein
MLPAVYRTMCMTILTLLRNSLRLTAEVMKYRPYGHVSKIIQIQLKGHSFKKALENVLLSFQKRVYDFCFESLSIYIISALNVTFAYMLKLSFK